MLRKKCNLLRCLLVISIAGLTLVAGPATAQTTEWVRTWGGARNQLASGVAADGLGNVYFTGGLGNVIIGMFDEAGDLRWARELTSESNDSARAVASDGIGNAYITGVTSGSLGGPNAGGQDAFISKYNDAGVLQWTRQLGTGSSDEGVGVSTDGLGNVYISGNTFGDLGGSNAGFSDAFLSKYDSEGEFQWTRQLGTQEYDLGFGVAADGLGNVYISGRTEGALSGRKAGRDDAYIAKYNSNGVHQWTRQFGTQFDDEGLGIAVDGFGNTYIGGNTYGSLGGPSAGFVDAFVSKYDADGVLQWSRQLGSDAFDFSFHLSSDASGDVFIAGRSEGILPGSNDTQMGAFVSKYDSLGSLEWTQRFGDIGIYEAGGVSADGLGNVYMAGPIEGSGPGTNLEVAVVKIAIPEPSSLTLGLLFGTTLLRRHSITEKLN